MEKLAAKLWDRILMIRYFKSWQYRKANYMHYCNECEEYSRHYQMELKRLSCDKYNKVIGPEPNGLTKPTKACPHCLSLDLTTIGDNDVRNSRKPWLDHDLKAPKMGLAMFVKYNRTVNRVEKRNELVSDIDHFIKHNKLICER